MNKREKGQHVRKNKVAFDLILYSLRWKKIYNIYSTGKKSKNIIYLKSRIFILFYEFFFGHFLHAMVQNNHMIYNHFSLVKVKRRRVVARKNTNNNRMNLKKKVDELRKKIKNIVMIIWYWINIKNDICIDYKNWFLFSYTVF